MKTIADKTIAPRTFAGKKLVTFLGIIAVAGLLATEVLGFGPGQHNITVKSGREKKAAVHWASQINNAPVPYSIRISEPPRHGTVRVRQEAGRTMVLYKSNTGYTGTDSFKYVRVSDDRFGGTYAVAVTVR